jgi:hypothetical protein
MHDNWLHRTGHNRHRSITQNIAWVAYQVLTTPWRWQPCAEKCRGRKIWNVLIKIHCFLEHLLVFLQTVLHDPRFNYQDNFYSFLRMNLPCDYASLRISSCFEINNVLCIFKISCALRSFTENTLCLWNWHLQVKLDCTHATTTCGLWF